MKQARDVEKAQTENQRTSERKIYGEIKRKIDSEKKIDRKREYKKGGSDMGVLGSRRAMAFWML